MWRGELGYLAAISPTVHRLALELTDRQASALTAAIRDTTAVPPEIAQLQGTALAAVFHIVITEAGRRTSEGQIQTRIAEELNPKIGNILDELDRWLSGSEEAPPRNPRRNRRPTSTGESRSSFAETRLSHH